MYSIVTSGVATVHVLRFGLQDVDFVLLGIDRNAYFFSHIFFPENRSFYEINMKNMAGSGRSQNNTAQKSWGVPIG